MILAVSIVGPLGLSFDRKVSFYKKWKHLFIAMLLPALLYIIWDIWFTHLGVWSFNATYITGIKLVNLPIEEVLFFFVVPYNCVFIYECIVCYFPNIYNGKTADRILIGMGVLSFIVGILLNNKYYSGYTFILLGLFIGLLFLFRSYFRSFKTGHFLVAYGVILIPFLVVNGFLTAIPVVQYNDAENIGFRIYTIPFEDIFYGMLLVLMNITMFEKLRNRV
ncbi:MAG: lycopene cyclase domain-containing protein [Ferruginibacter sp.]